MSVGPRVSTAIRFDPALHEALKETADELMVSVTWLVSKLCEEGLARIDLTKFSLVRARDTVPVELQNGNDIPDWPTP